MVHVIAICGPPGSGKTSLMNAIGKRLPDSSAIEFDAYERATGRPARAVADWLRAGAAADALDVSVLADMLARLRAGETVADPVLKRRLYARPHVLFETPLGRAHQGLARSIDLLLWIDVPLDVALARNIRAFAEQVPASPSVADARRFVSWIHGYAGNYVSFVHAALQLQRERIAPDADVTLDGMSTVEEMAEQSVREIRRRCP